MRNKNRGVTLIALAVTIIVMLILAGATMSVLTGDSGIITNAKKSKKENEIASAQEAARLLYAEMLQNNYNGDLTEEEIITGVYEGLTDQGYTIEQPEGNEGNITGITCTSSLALKKGESGEIKVTFESSEGNNYLKIGKEYHLITISESEGVQISKESENIKSNGSLIKDKDITSTNSQISASVKADGTITVKGNEVGIGKITIKYGNFETSCNIQIYSESEDKANFIEAEDIADSSDKSEYYGQWVDGYADSFGRTGWEIFYADSDNIYLIAGNYIEDSGKLPQKNGKAMTDSGYRAQKYNDEILNQYPDGIGTIANKNQKLLTKWLSKYVNSANFSTGKDNNSKVAYMLDTEIWNELYLVDGLADYVIGSPTLEMFIKSWNSVHGDNKKIECTTDFTENQGEQSYGYAVKLKNGTTFASLISIEADEKYQGLYQFLTNGAALNLYIASPCWWDSNGFMAISSMAVSNKTLFGATTNNNIGFRPIVCLSKGIKLKRLDNGNFQIVGTE